MRRGVPLSSSMARTRHRVGAAVTGTAQPPRHGVMEAPPCKNRDGWHQMFLIPTRGRVVTPERTDDPERTPNTTCAGRRMSSLLAFRVRDTNRQKQRQMPRDPEPGDKTDPMMGLCGPI